MKTKLNYFYRRYLPEIMTGILASLVVITVLLIFGIWNADSDRKIIMQDQDVMIQKQDSIYLQEAEHLSKKLDTINKTK